jgi:hypothetical protein
MSQVTKIPKIDQEMAMPEHLISLPGGQWKLWRWVCLRSAGFPAKQVLNLAGVKSVADGNELLDAEEQLQVATTKAISMVSEHLQSASPENRSPLLKALKALKKAKVPSQINIDSLQEIMGTLSSADLRVQALRYNYEQSFHADSIHIANRIYETARLEKFREAIIWQNRRALHTGIEPLLRHQNEKDARSSKQRRNEEMVARYLQRYCTKNDTVGFFGPVGWVRLDREGPPILVKPGPQLLASRKVFMEVWCIDELANALAKDKAILKWVAPRLMHHIQVIGRTVHIPLRKPLILSPQEAALLHACNGVRSAKEIALELMHTGFGGLKSEAEGYNLIESLRARGLLKWNLEVPIEAYPEKSLRQILLRIDDENISKVAISALDEIESSKEAIARASGSATELNQAFERIEASFTRLTGSAATQLEGQTYAGRTLLYEDCRRDIEVQIGPPLLQSLGPPLSLLLQSVRWLTYQLAVKYNQIFKDIFSQLAGKSGTRVLPFLSFWYLVCPLFWQDQTDFSSAIEAEFQQKWQSILQLGENCSQVEYSCEQLQSAVAEIFKVPHSGWPSIRYTSPDIMIAASGPEAIAQGDYQFVLGEMHVGVNTLNTQLFVLQHPSPDDLYRAAALDQGPRIVPIIPKNFRGKTSRSSPMLFAPTDFHLELAPEPVNNSRSPVLPIGSLLIENDGRSLIVRPRDGKLRFGVEEILCDAAAQKIVNSFKILAPSAHNPRITIDKLVVFRESWSFNAKDLDFNQEKTDSARFLSVRRWAREKGLPRFVFVKAPSEVKPFFLDFDSPHCVNIFTKAVRQSAMTDAPERPITLSEMVPSLEEIWLPDAEGQRYTSELRFVALDISQSGNLPGMP